MSWAKTQSSQSLQTRGKNKNKKFSYSEEKLQGPVTVWREAEWKKC